MLATAAYQLATKNSDGALVAAEGLAVSFVPVAIARLCHTPMPRPLEAAFVFGMALQFESESTKLFELLLYWDKLVHPTLIALTGMIGAWLLIGFRDAFRKRIPIHLVAAFGILLGISVGAFWEFVEFTIDWFSNADLQKSNADTITDIISNDIGAFVATLLGLWLYTHKFSQEDRENTGRVARWLAHGPRILLSHHGRVVGSAVALVLAGLVFLSQWVDRDTPALASGLSQGEARSWHFADSAPLTGTVVLSGDWVPDPRGACHENLENPKPGSEKMGLLQLAPGTVYAGAFTIEARYFEQRPSITQGSEMDAGVAFGIRDANDFDLVEQNALHDILRLDRFVNGRRRVAREKLFRTHGNEWHTLRVAVAGASVSATVDGQTIYTVDNVPVTDGGIGLWARAAGDTCFSDVSVSVGELP